MSVLLLGCSDVAGLGDLDFENQAATGAIGAGAGGVAGGVSTGAAGSGGAGAVSSYALEVMSDDPIAYWRFEETSGSVLADEMGNRNGSAAGGIILGVAGLVEGKAAMFDGEDAQVIMGNDVFDFLHPAPFSFEAWISHRGSSDDQGIVSKRPSNNAGYSFRLDGNEHLEMALFTDAGSHDTDTTIELSEATAHHVVATYDGAEVTLYLNAIPSASDTPAMELTLNSGPFVVGADGSSDFFDGVIDEVAVYDYALAIERVSAHYNAGRQ